MYPAAHRAAFSYPLHGTVVPDPYHWLEDPYSSECKAFVTAQNNAFEAFMRDSSERRGALKKRLEEAQDYARTSCPSMRRSWYYYSHNQGLQNQAVVMRATGLGGENEEVFFDPNALSSDGTSALSTAAWSHSDSKWAYSVSEKGSDWQKVRVRDGNTKKDFPDVIDWVKFSGISWYEDEGFFYTRYPSLRGDADKGTETDTAENPFICYHALGTPQDADVKVLDLPDHPKWSLGAEVSDCNRYLIVSIHDGCEPNCLIWIAKIGEGGPLSGPLHFKKLINEFVGDYNYLGNDGPVFYFSTTRDAPKKKIMSMHVESREEKTLVPEQESVLSFSGLVLNTLVLCYMEHVKDVLYYSSLQDPMAQTRIHLPIGSVQTLSCRRNKSTVSVKLASFLLPGRSYVFDICDPNGTLTVFRDDIVKGLDPDSYTTEQVFYSSADGCKIPMFVVHHKTIERNGQNPLLLYGYGGFSLLCFPRALT